MNTNKTQVEQLTQDAVMQSVLKANDLRIGCIIEKSGDICSVASINSDNTIRIFNEDKTDTWGCFALRIFNPIPLTEEWLIKLGFERDLQINLYRLYNDFGTIVYYPKSSVEKSKFSFMLIGYCFVTYEILHLHELQNLYFALTGSELTVA